MNARLEWLADAEPVRAGFERLPVTRYRHDVAVAETDAVSEEVPVALVFNGISHAVMMATPRDLEVFGVGFALSEGIVAGTGEVFECEVQWHEMGAEVRITLSQQALFALKARRRAMTGRTGCGVCGIESLSMLDLAPERVPASPLHIDIPRAVARAARELPRFQGLMAETGGLHAAAWCDREGQVQHAFEDVGRHNALDKLLGTLALAGTDFGAGFVFLSSRASYELIRKAARLGVPMVATISAPTSLAIGIARQAGIRLVSFCRENGCVVFA